VKRLDKWWRRRQFIKACQILKRESEYHKANDHLMDFRAVNESLVLMRCTACPDLTPDRKKKR